MRKVLIDSGLCTGCGICVEACPEVFAFDADRKAQVIKDNADDTASDLEGIAITCPTNAIELR